MAMSNGYIIGFAAGICIVCSLGVATASMGLRDLQQANERKAFQEKVLAAVNLEAKTEGGERLDAKGVDALFTDRLKLTVIDESGVEQMPDATDAEKLAAVDEARAKVKGTGKAPALNPVYRRVSAADKSKTEAVALELQGKGLWGPISGYLALEPDGKTVLNVAFDAPKETPGLGAEIMNPSFKNQWAGKSIADVGQAVPIRVVKSAVLECQGRVEHCVDGVSGATITSRGVDAMVQKAVNTEYANYLKKIQAGG